MTLLFLTPFPSSHPGGVERHVQLLTRELEKRRHRVEELCLKESNRNMERTVLSIPKGPSFKYQAWKRLWDKRKLIEQSDLVHVHDMFWWYLPFRFLFPNKPVFTTFHGWEGIYPPTRSAVFQKRLAQRLSWGTIGVGTFFEKWYGVRPTLTTFGVLDPQVKEVGKRLRMPEKIKRITFFGRLEPVNGIDIVLPVLFKLRSVKSVKYQILYIGDGSWRDQAKKVGRVTGMVKNPWTYLLKSDLVITSSYLSMLEAAALSRPIIAIATNPLKLDYLQTHPMFPYLKVAKTSQQIIEVIKKFTVSDHRDAIGLAKRWSLAQTPQRLTDLYEKLWTNRTTFSPPSQKPMAFTP